MTLVSRLLALTFISLLSIPTAHAWDIGSELDHAGCHEKITEAAFRAARAKFDTAPVIPATDNERALFGDVQFVPPPDFEADVAGMSLLLGVRDNDLKGKNPLDTLQLVQVHGDPATQEEHCIRGASDDDLAGNEAALAKCRAFIVRRATEALAGLDDNNVVDADNRLDLPVYVSVAGHVKPPLVRFYVRLGMAVHALEDGFTHTYRSEDGLQVTVVENWIEAVDGTPKDEHRDGPSHLPGLDYCESGDPLVQRNYQLATEATTELISAALDPSLSYEAKIARFEEITNTYLTYAPGCTFENKWCDAREPKVPDESGCSVAATNSPLPWLPIAFVIGGVLLVRKRRPASIAASALVLAFAVAHTARAQPAPEPAPVPSTPVVPAGTGGTPDQPAIPVRPRTPADVANATNGEEPGREEKTPTLQELKEVREDKRLGNPLGFAMMLGGSVVHGSMAGAVAMRYRLSETWVLGLDAEWNPWITPQPLAWKSGSANVYATLIRRYPMKFDRVNLRTSLHLGASMLLFDVYGAPKYDIGPFASFAPLGIDYDLGNSVRLVIDPVEIAVPIPHLGLIPLYYEQFRLMIGLQVGA